MRGRFILTACLLAGMTAKAQNYSYLAFVAQDGSTTTLTSDGLELRVEDGSFVAVAHEGTVRIPLSTLQYLAFTDTQTSIEGVASESVGKDAEVFDLTGKRLGSGRTAEDALGVLPRGVYILRQGGESRKIVKP